MKGRNRVFKVGALHHIYQRTVDGYLIFYSIRDYLVFFTLICTIARKYGIVVLGVCLMCDHIHILVKAPSKKVFSAFVQEYTCRFSRQRNIHYHRKGQFFRHRFGSAPKVNEKKSRTAIAYLYNNPVEKKLCNEADDFQWNFLKYAHNRHPFSTNVPMNRVRRPMRRAMEEIRLLRLEDIPLTYPFIDRIIKGLTHQELSQLTDYIVTTYNCIDYEVVSSFYDDFKSMLVAIHSNTGSEYQIREVITPDSDAIFHRMQSSLREIGEGYADITAVLSLPDSEKRQLAWILAAETGASPSQISKFLQMTL